VSFLDFTQADDYIWQRRAAAALVRLLDEHRDLPVIAWTVGSAGSVLVGRVNGLQPAATARAVFDVWTAALTLCQRWERTDLTLTHLSARSRRGNVTIVLLADLILDEDGGRR
jgi:hypothetical protein